MGESFNHLPGVVHRFSGQMSQVLVKLTEAMEKDIKESMPGEKHGRLYKVSKTGAPHRASAPGEAPAIETGHLVNSIQTSEVEQDGDVLRASVFTNTEYAPILEFGSATMEARPFMTPAAMRAKDTVEQIGLEIKIEVG